ncbi:MAG: 6-bladed beta-propeller [Prevotellaceae bacterium]|jgi:hypothetical protein|nr:6-bladed beta-propeller [Prevotellaceae bacterium]
MKRPILLGILLLLSLFSCKNNNKPSDNLPRLTIQKTTGKEGLFIKNFELESIVPIETKNDFIISTIKKVIYDHDNIIILDDKSSIFVIDSGTGKAKFTIDRKGQGPGESRLILDITLDTRSKNIIALNDYKKIIFFSPEGEFLYQESVKTDFENIVFDKGKVILYLQGEGYGTRPYFIDIYNIQDKTWTREGSETKVDFMFRPYGRQMVNSRQIWFAPPLGYQFGKITDNKPEFLYSLQTERTMTQELIELSLSDHAAFFRKANAEKIIYGTSSIRETDNFLIFKTNILKFLIMEKNTLTVFEESSYDANLGIPWAEYFPHDGDDNRIMFIIQPDQWLNRIKNENIPPHLQTLFNSVQLADDNNPVLIFYKEKQIP